MYSYLPGLQFSFLQSHFVLKLPSYVEKTRLLFLQRTVSGVKRCCYFSRKWEMIANIPKTLFRCGTIAGVDHQWIIISQMMSKWCHWFCGVFCCHFVDLLLHYTSSNSHEKFCWESSRSFETLRFSVCSKFPRCTVVIEWRHLGAHVRTSADFMYALFVHEECVSMCRAFSLRLSMSLYTHIQQCTVRTNGLVWVGKSKHIYSRGKALMDVLTTHSCISTR